MKENWTYRRGDIYLANLNPYIGSEQGGTRPVLLLQNNTGNFYCPTLIVSYPARMAFFCSSIFILSRSVILRLMVLMALT